MAGAGELPRGEGLVELHGGGGDGRLGAVDLGLEDLGVALQPLGQHRQAGEGVALGALVDRELLGELAGPAGQVADLGGGLLEG